MIEIINQKYRIINKIGAGGMSEIYLAIDKTTNKKVAIKILNTSVIKKSNAKKRFESEIKLLKQVDSENVVKYIDSYVTEKSHYLVMEYIDGEILKDRISRLGRLTVDETIMYGKQIAKGLLELHRRKIIHRDIKSKNVVISNNEVAKIIDLGIAVNEQSETLTKANSVIGSVYYMAPELIKKNKASEKSDIYSLGILLFEMLSGDVPLKGLNHVDTMKKHKNCAVPNITNFCENVPQSLENIIIKSTALDANKRYSDMSEFYYDLSTCLSPQRYFEKPLSLSENKKMTFTQVINSKWTLAFALVFLVAALGVILFVILKGGI